MAKSNAERQAAYRARQLANPETAAAHRASQAEAQRQWRERQLEREAELDEHSECPTRSVVGLAGLADALEKLAEEARSLQVVKPTQTEKLSAALEPQEAGSSYVQIYCVPHDVLLAFVPESLMGWSAVQSPVCDRLEGRNPTILITPA